MIFKFKNRKINLKIFKTNIYKKVITTHRETNQKRNK